MATVSVSEFKARCLSLLAEVARTGESLTVLKRGRPLARVVPAVAETAGYPQQALAGSLEIVGDVITPPLPADEWEAEQG